MTQTREIILIRHAYSGPVSASYAAYGNAGGPIIERGIEQAKELREKLLARGFDITHEPVAVSEMLRTQQTAEVAGLANVTVNPLLNEVNTGDPERTLALVAKDKLPKQAIAAAKALLANPPAQNIWVTHGLPMAALLVVLGLSDPDHFVPANCEIRVIRI